MSKLSVVIPSVTDHFLQPTIDDLLDKAADTVEVVVVLDGYEAQVATHPRVRVLHQEPQGMRAAINHGMAAASGEFVMKLDEHCLVAPGYDRALAADCAADWVVIPRRYRLDAERWTVLRDGRPPIDYMRIEDKGGYLHGTEDRARACARADVLVDDTMTMQGSCYFMRRDYWFSHIGPLDDVHYGPFANEAQEVGLRCWLGGGRVVVNKKTWYAHWHRDRRGYGWTNGRRRGFDADVERGRAWAADYWLNNRWRERVHDYDWLVAKFKG